MLVSHLLWMLSLSSTSEEMYFDWPSYHLLCRWVIMNKRQVQGQCCPTKDQSYAKHIFNHVQYAVCLISNVLLCFFTSILLLLYACSQRGTEMFHHHSVRNVQFDVCKIFSPFSQFSCHLKTSQVLFPFVGINDKKVCCALFCLMCLGDKAVWYMFVYAFHKQLSNSLPCRDFWLRLYATMLIFADGYCLHVVWFRQHLTKLCDLKIL